LRSNLINRERRKRVSNNYKKDGSTTQINAAPQAFPLRGNEKGGGKKRGLINSFEKGTREILFEKKGKNTNNPTKVVGPSRERNRTQTFRKEEGSYPLRGESSSKSGLSLRKKEPFSLREKRLH